MQKTVQKLITPDDKTIEGVFNTSNSYYIDIYQREYKWSHKQVQTLLNDIQVRFDVGTIKEDDPPRIREDVLSNFEPYFVNTFLTNEVPGKKNIVDGQQRLTTFLIILIKLYQIAKSEKEKNQDLKIYEAGYIEDRIFESGAFGEKKFKIHNDNREKAFAAILALKHEGFINADETQYRIIENYKFISTYYDKLFFEGDNKFDATKFNYYLTYLLNRISIVEIQITSSHNVAMIFEVVNDRGLGLKPFEILKGKFLGILDEKQKEGANKAWSEILDDHYKANSDVDDFFKLYFRSKFAKNLSEYERMENEYHYEVYKNSSIRKYLNDFKDKQKLFDFVTQELKFFSALYLELQKTINYRFVLYNRMLDQKQQYMLIMSATKYNDPTRSEKIDLVSKKFDQMHILLRLKNLYDSSSFLPTYIIDICTRIRELDLDKITSQFDAVVIGKMEENETIPKSTLTKISDLFSTFNYQSLIHQNKNLSKYILLRIDETLSKLMGRASLVTNSTIDIENLFNRTNRKSYELHLEHMYAHNEKNESLFLNSEGDFDYYLFDKLRNQFGALLILKDQHNLSSGADIYKDKMELYGQSNIIWNEMLAGQIPAIDLRKLPFDFTFSIHQPNNEGLLEIAAIEERQKELYELIKYTWSQAF
ncbi:hypothetical protein B0A80_15705 [Flavobacterium tructae]|uniref:DUF262 domain-containing protein n=1 Tax=Flavobacterium tructae TaxID=1114873 RepID=UPI000B5BBA11|nr:DUF262 domain-containing protein [Flavobacterium tructae]OXB22553.1 hypothetical protein B0A80_15705 [Flavobacterium tructae]